MLNSANDALNIFVDEAGDPTLFANRRRAIVGTPGCSRFFILGKLEVDDPAGLGHRLTDLRHTLLANPYFANVPSFDPTRDKTAVMFHAKDDVPEVRYEVFKLLVAESAALRFHAVVCDKEQVVQDVLLRNQTEPDYRYQQKEKAMSIGTPKVHTARGRVSLTASEHSVPKQLAYLQPLINPSFLP
ncbi:MAG: hypothetical protein Q8O52_24235 [Sulfuritalea sp.]|nr:hypothetical protein [Sulfuritalea sp.]